MKHCIICDIPLKSNLYVAMYCTECRQAVSSITTAVSRTMRAAKIPKATDYDCQDCGKPATEWDHRYYSLPLEVDPVCTACNQRRGPARDIVDMVRTERGLDDWRSVESQANRPAPPTLQETLQQAERKMIEDALIKAHWNATAAAKALQIPYRSIRYRMQRLGISRK